MKATANHIADRFCVILSLAALLFVLPFTASAQESPQSLFDRANDHLGEGNLQQALALYRSLEAQDRISGALYLNMGISYVQFDSLGKAKYYFLKARRFPETRDRARQGLNYVESQFSRQSAVLPKLPWERFFEWLGEAFGSVALLGTGIIVLNLGIASFVVNWFVRTFKKPLRWSGIGIGVLGLFIILASFFVRYQQNRYSKAVMVHREAKVLEQPRTDAAVVSQAYEGYTFTVDHYRSEEYPEWTYVRMSNGLYGWIPEREILVL